ncbi:MAG: tyrosine--tRNA ligase [Clostridiales bacterium]|jgi:tyrosyl-tRNA synthetase|nr:tyrosine--tRNA ligase [Clostridiales bacterium]
MENVFDTLTARGFIEQCTHEEKARELLGKEKVTFYIGFDPTADSLHVGHYLTAMAMSHMQKAGHRPILLMGGGTGMIGDPTDKTEMRRIMTREEIDYNISCFKKQLSRFIDVSDGNAVVVNNADWLLELKYLPFIREYGIHFSVNKMLTADSYRTRFERGLSFFEFNYQLLQAYDFLELYRKHGCKLQMGGRDQWSNIIAGIELIRRVEDEEVQGVTFSLLAKSDGTKMGKSQKGAIWLDGEKTSPYEFFQYWRNVDDQDVIRFMKLLTYLSLDEIKEYETLTGSALNKAKEVLAFEITKNVHGQEEAEKALDAAKTLFSGTGGGEGIPTAVLTTQELAGGINIIDLLMKTSLVKSRSDARRLIEQNSIKVNGEAVSAFDKAFSEADFAHGAIMVQKGKKGYHRVKIEG